mgnify:CR=1 FL=1
MTARKDAWEINRQIMHDAFLYGFDIVIWWRRR